MIAFLSLLLTLHAPALAQEPALEAVEAVEHDLLAELEALRLRVEDQEKENAALRHQLEARDVVRVETLDVDLEDLEVAPERMSIGGSVVVEAGELVQEAVAIGGDVEVSGHVVGDATAVGGSVLVRDGGAIDGDAVSLFGRVGVEPGGMVDGDRVGVGFGVFEDHRVHEVARASARDVGSGLLTALYHRVLFMLSFLGAGVLIVGLFPERIGRVSAALEARPLRSLAVGFFATIALLVAAMLFIVTIVGIPLSVLLIAVLGLSWLVGFVGLCQALGDRLPFLDKPNGRWVTFLVGALVVSFVGVLPIVGWLVVGGASVLGMGAALTSRFGSA